MIDINEDLSIDDINSIIADDFPDGYNSVCSTCTRYTCQDGYCFAVDNYSDLY